MNITRWILAAGVLCTMAAGAIVPPNFSGTWKLNNDKSTPDGTADRTYVSEVKQDAKSIIISTKATPAPPQPPLDGTFKIQKSDSKAVATTQGGHFHSQRAFFEGETLIFEIVDRDGPIKKPTLYKVVRESWVLSPDKKVLTRFRRTAAGSIVDQKYVFEKQ